MKRYLLGFGAMLVGAGLMFVLTHTEVSAESETDRCDDLEIPSFNYKGEIKGKRSNAFPYTTFKYCKIRDLTCVLKLNQISCVKTKGGIFK
jgi:hypothetical protein